GWRYRRDSAGNGSASCRLAFLHQGFEGGAHRGCSHLADQLGSGAVGEHLALVQHDNPRALTDLVDQMRGPQRGETFLTAEPAYMVEHELAARDIEPDRRLVEQQQARLMQ